MKHTTMYAVLVMSMVLSTTPRAQDVRKIDVGKLGPQIGEMVPDFNLSDQHGKTWTLRSLMGPTGVMIVFLRSADW